MRIADEREMKAVFAHRVGDVVTAPKHDEGNEE